MIDDEEVRGEGGYEPGIEGAAGGDRGGGWGERVCAAAGGRGGGVEGGGIEIGGGLDESEEI